MRRRRVTHIISNLQAGGTEGVLFRLVSVTRHEFDHTVISLSDGGYYGEQLRDIGVKVVCAGLDQKWRLIYGLGSVFSAISQTRPDVIQTWLYHADLLGVCISAICGSIPVCWGVRGERLDQKALGWRTWLLTRVNAKISGFPKVIVSCSSRAARAHEEIGFKAAKLTVIPNGFDNSRFFLRPDSRISTRNVLGIPDGLPLIGMVARWDRQKDHGNLFSALSILKQRGVEFRCVLVGIGMDQENSSLLRMIEKTGLEENILLLGRRSDLLDIYNALDVHVLSSQGEGFPNVVAESMLCGVVNVVTDVGEASAIVGEAGWVVPPGDAGALADTMQESLNEILSSRRHALAMAARNRVIALFGLDMMVAAYRRVWAECWNSNQNGN